MMTRKRPKPLALLLLLSSCLHAFSAASASGGGGGGGGGGSARGGSGKLGRSGKLTPASQLVQGLISDAYFCPKEFVPARPGGFSSWQAKQGCCVAGKGVAFMDITFALHKCTRFQLHHAGAPCYAGALRDLEADLSACCVVKEAGESESGEDEKDDGCTQTIAAARKAIVAELQPLYMACVAKCAMGGCVAGHSKACKTAMQGSVSAFQRILAAALKLYALGDGQQRDFTKHSFGFMHLCRHVGPTRYLNKMKHVLSKFHLKYEW